MTLLIFEGNPCKTKPGWHTAAICLLPDKDGQPVNPWYMGMLDEWGRFYIAKDECDAWGNPPPGFAFVNDDCC